MNRQLIALLVAVSLAGSAFAKDVPVRGYTRKDGTVVAPYVRSSPNSTKSDNYSTKGNANPYTGKVGTKTDGSTPNAPSTSPAVATASISRASTAKLPPANLALVAVGMKKPQVMTAVGEPNIKTDRVWYYIDSGFVRFEGDKVAKIESRPGS